MIMGFKLCTRVGRSIIHNGTVFTCITFSKGIHSKVRLIICELTCVGIYADSYVQFMRSMILIKLPNTQYMLLKEISPLITSHSEFLCPK